LLGSSTVDVASEFTREELPTPLSSLFLSLSLSLFPYLSLPLSPYPILPLALIPLIALLIQWINLEDVLS
jgi:hypothetical protein